MLIALITNDRLSESHLAQFFNPISPLFWNRKHLPILGSVSSIYNEEYIIEDGRYIGKNEAGSGMNCKLGDLPSRYNGIGYKKESGNLYGNLDS